jgi:citrate synthase
MYPNKEYGFGENFLHMLFDKPNYPHRVSSTIAKAMEMIFVLHADHEQNCSTSTVRMVGSSHANLFASVSAGINALFGPLHGGANQAVLEMLEGIQSSGDTVQQFITRVKNREDGVKLMGFGHRVYKSYDPRAAIVREHAHDILAMLGVKDPLFDIARELEEAALSDEFFIERKLYPNVDFYSGIIYKALGIPTEMFTVMFALGRLPGWIAQWKEMIEDPGMKIGRPRQIYTGETPRKYVPVDQRK